MCAGVLQRRGFREGLAQAGQESEEEGPLGRTQAGRRGGPADKGGGLSRSEQKQPSQEEGLERSLWGQQGLEGGARLPPEGGFVGTGWRKGPLPRRTTREAPAQPGGSSPRARAVLGLPQEGQATWGKCQREREGGGVDGAGGLGAGEGDGARRAAWAGGGPELQGARVTGPGKGHPAAGAGAIS